MSGGFAWFIFINCSRYYDVTKPSRQSRQKNNRNAKVQMQFHKKSLKH